MIFFAVHCLIWKIRIPRRQVNTLMLLFACVMAFGFILFRIYFSEARSYGVFIPVSDYVHGCFLFAVLTAAYIVSYPAVEVDSPSFVIITRIANAGSEGLAEQTLDQDLTDDVLVKPRLEDLVTEKMILPDTNGRYRLTLKGRWFIRPFFLYRKLIGAGKGG